MLSLNVTLSVDEAGSLVQQAIETGAFSAELCGSYLERSPQGHTALTLVFEKYYMRSSGRASLTVALNDLTGTTKVWALGAGGRDGGLFSFDLGTGEDFEREVRGALGGYIL